MYIYFSCAAYSNLSQTKDMMVQYISMAVYYDKEITLFVNFMQ